MNNDQIRSTLESLKAEIEARLQRTHKHIYQKDEAVSADFHEQVKQTENDQLVYTLEEEGKNEIQQINHALQRLENGEYGRCAQCGNDIADARLEAIPYAELCINCA